MSTIVDRARLAVRQEGSQLIGMFKNTLTFTITFEVVSSIIKTRIEIVPVLLPTSLVAVMGSLMATMHLKDLLVDYTKQEKRHYANLISAFLSAIESISSVAVQFTSNLVAMGLSRVIANSKDIAWVLWFVVVAIGMLYVATEVLSKGRSQ
jgi:hypothetical protein